MEYDTIWTIKLKLLLLPVFSTNLEQKRCGYQRRFLSTWKKDCSSCEFFSEVIPVFVRWQYTFIGLLLADCQVWKEVMESWLKDNCLSCKGSVLSTSCRFFPPLRITIYDIRMVLPNLTQCSFKTLIRLNWSTLRLQGYTHTFNNVIKNTPPWFLIKCLPLFLLNTSCKSNWCLAQFSNFQTVMDMI